MRSLARPSELETMSIISRSVIEVSQSLRATSTKLANFTIVGVGAQSDSCGECVECENGKETHCLNATNTYGDIYKDNSGKSYGGYANYNRAPGRFVFRIPDELDSAEAAPMLCGGVTVYSPLKQNGCGPGKNVRLGML
jgi:D-arabinose 1-dehydrogenase-like Zn-dependent alcohol dehydrogenase